MASDHEDLLLAGDAEWRAWLDRHHEESSGVWLVLAKKGTTEPTTLTYEQALLRRSDLLPALYAAAATQGLVEAKRFLGEGVCRVGDD